MKKLYKTLGAIPGYGYLEIKDDKDGTFSLYCNHDGYRLHLAKDKMGYIDNLLDEYYFNWGGFDAYNKEILERFYPLASTSMKLDYIKKLHRYIK